MSCQIDQVSEGSTLSLSLSTSLVSLMVQVSGGRGSTRFLVGLAIGALLYFDICSLNVIGLPAMRHYGGDAPVCLWRSIGVPDSFCIYEADIEMLTFDVKSKVKTIRNEGFRRCSVKSICIPHAVKDLGEICFSEAKSGEFAFESRSRMAQVRDLGFWGPIDLHPVPH
jgi:hypothetical protein